MVTAASRFRIPVAGEPHEELTRTAYDDDAVDLGDADIEKSPQLSDTSIDINV